MQAAQQFKPMAGEIDDGLDLMEKLFEQLMVGVDLPEGTEWLDHLDVLGAIRTDTLQTFKPFDEYWPSKTPGYVSVGVESDSETVGAALIEIFGHRVYLVPVTHELKPGFSRVALPFSEAIGINLRSQGNSTEAEIAGVIAIAQQTFKIDEIDAALVPAFMERVRAREYHGRIAEWWGAIPAHFTITAVGRVLARANAKRLDELGLLPALD